jgi:hypothetical protein
MSESGVSAELSAHIRQRLAEYLSASAPDPLDLRTVVAKFGALPLVSDMGGAVALRHDGEVISFAWDEPHNLAIETDPRLRKRRAVSRQPELPRARAVGPRASTERGPVLELRETREDPAGGPKHCLRLRRPRLAAPLAGASCGQAEGRRRRLLP